MSSCFSVFAEKIWDPLSTTQTSRLVNVVQKIINEYPSVHADNKKTQELLRAVVNRMKKTLDDDVFMPLYPKSVTENRGSGSSVFFHRQSWTCIKLLGNILSWHGILSSKVLHSLALDGLLNRYIILGLCNSPIGQETIQKCQSIISTFPKQWFTGLTEDRTMPQLENLCRYLVSIFNSIHTQSRTDFQKMEAKEYAKQIRVLTVDLYSMYIIEDTLLMMYGKPGFFANNTDNIKGVICKWPIGNGNFWAHAPATPKHLSSYDDIRKTVAGGDLIRFVITTRGCKCPPGEDCGDAYGVIYEG
ncbi:GCFC [Mytilus edulis]|uniref:GCFC n=1 Tax=Mytilus edulis TaxID=6550 RepID=A0A8S3PNH4_MYTED|nr:GCFC [Mytilus edulis]